MQRNRKAKAKRLAFIDMDGTLLGPEKTISKDNVRALDRLRDAGVEVVVASGRHHDNLRQFTRRIGELEWLVSSNGSVVESLRTGEVLLEISMPPDVVLEICQRARSENVSLIAYHREGAFVEESTVWSALYARATGWTPQVRNFATLPPDRFQKIIWTGPAGLLSTFAPVLSEEFAGRAQVLRTEAVLLEFFSPAANKAVGARALATKRDLPSDCTLAFGDGSNDVEILRWAGISVAMAHGHAQAHEAARHVSPVGPSDTAFARAVELALATAA